MRKALALGSIIAIATTGLITLRHINEEKISNDIGEIIYSASCDNDSDRDFARRLADYIAQKDLPWQKNDDVYANYSFYKKKAVLRSTPQKKCNIKEFSPPSPTGDANRERSRRRNQETIELLDRIKS